MCRLWHRDTYHVSRYTGHDTWYVWRYVSRYLGRDTICVMPYRRPKYRDASMHHYDPTNHHSGLSFHQTLSLICHYTHCNCSHIPQPCPLNLIHPFRLPDHRHRENQCWMTWVIIIPVNPFPFHSHKHWLTNVEWLVIIIPVNPFPFPSHKHWLTIVESLSE